MPLQSAGTLGDNQTVALFELDGYQSSDVTQYFQNYNLGSPVITNVLVDGFSGSAGQGAIEDELYIEVVAAIAPRAKQIVYEGPNTTQGLNDTYNKIVTDNKAQVVSTSWGLCETSSGTSELQTLDTISSKGRYKASPSLLPRAILEPMTVTIPIWRSIRLPATPTSPRLVAPTCN